MAVSFKISLLRYTNIIFMTYFSGNMDVLLMKDTTPITRQNLYTILITCNGSVCAFVGVLQP